MDKESFCLALETQLRPALTHEDFKVLFPPENLIDKKPTPFSKAVRRKVGECLERAVLVQLAQQEKGISYFVSGLYSNDRDQRTFLHAYNIIFEDEKPLLVDSQNPMLGPSGLIPYIVPVTSIKNGVVIVPEEWRAGRIYSFVPKRSPARSILSFF